MQFQLLRAAEVNALVGGSPVIPFLPVQLQRIAKALDDRCARAHDLHVRPLERNFARPEDDVAPALNQMQIGAGQRAAQLERRDGEIIAVHRFRQILEARAAAVELSDGNGRDERDAGIALDIEPQRIRDQTAVPFAACQLQLRLGLEEVEGVQLQFEGVELLALEGVDLTLDLGQLQPHQICGIKLARGVDAVDLEFMLLVQAVAQLFHCESQAIEDGLEADLAGKHKIARRVGRRLSQLYLGIRNVHIDDGVVLVGIDAKREAVLCERDLQPVFFAVFRLIELEAGGVQVHALLLHAAILMDDELSACAPRGRDGGGEQRCAAGKGEVRAVFAFIVAVDDRDGVSILLFQRSQRRVVRDVFHGHAVSARKRREPLGRDRDFDFIRLCDLIQ